jgi:hypothetical protein
VKRAITFLAIILCLCATAPGKLQAAPPAQQEQNKCLITSPANGSQVRGQVSIAGSATHANFQWYQVGYAPEPNPTGAWTFFYNSETAVPSGTLAVWNTTLIPDGTYQLILEVHRKDGDLDICFAKQLRVNNTAATPTATFTAAPLPTPVDSPTPLPTPEDTPTIVIEQPPTATSRPTPTYSAIDNPTPTPEMTRIKLPIEPASIRDASCRGAQLVIAIFAIAVIYLIVRGVTVKSVRKIWKPDDSKGYHSRRPRQY